MESSRNFTENSNFKCEICEKSFSTIHTKKLHIKTGPGHMDQNCDICSKSFSTKIGVMQHIKKAHKNIK